MAVQEKQRVLSGQIHIGKKKREEVWYEYEKHTTFS